MSKPTVVIIAGGENSRFFPLNFNTYKGAISLFGKPLVIRALESLPKHGYKKVVIVVSPQNYQGHGLSKIVDQAGLELDVKYVLQPEAKGMGDAVLQAREYLEDQFIVTSGYQLNLGELADQLLAQSESNVVCAAPTDEPWEYGILSVSEAGLATGIVEKPTKGKEPSNLKVQSLYLLDQAFLQTLSSVPESTYNFEIALDILMKKQSVAALKLDKSLASLKYAWHLFDFQTELFNSAKSHTAASAKVSPSAVIDDSQGPVIISDKAQIGHASRIVGPCFIGEQVEVGDFCLVRGSSIEAGTILGAYTEVARSIVLNHTKMHDTYLADSIVGSLVKIGAGLITANKRLDRANIPVTVKGRKVDSSRNSLGVLIGDEANLGIRVATMPGVCIGAQATVYPSVTVYRNLDHQQTLHE